MLKHSSRKNKNERAVRESLESKQDRWRGGNQQTGPMMHNLAAT
jgi:hypothetical protein